MLWRKNVLRWWVATHRLAQDVRLKRLKLFFVRYLSVTKEMASSSTFTRILCDNLFYNKTRHEHDKKRGQSLQLIKNADAPLRTETVSAVKYVSRGLLGRATGVSLR